MKKRVPKKIQERRLIKLLKVLTVLMYVYLVLYLYCYCKSLKIRDYNIYDRARGIIGAIGIYQELTIIRIRARIPNVKEKLKSKDYF